MVKPAWWITGIIIGQSLFCPTYGEDKPRDNSACFRCHAMATLAYREPATGGIVDLSVDPARYVESTHADLACHDCHGQNYSQYPHPAKLKHERLSCLTCHKDNPQFEKQFSLIEKQFQDSVHYRKLQDKFDCFSCHNPHEFEAEVRKKGAVETIRQHNRICLDCHGTQRRSSETTDLSLAELKVKHNKWLPKTGLHWDTVRCIECHTPHFASSPHVILATEKSERGCVVCHTKDSILLTKLYKHRVHEERQKAGFANSVVLNDSYIIGMTRHRILDNLSALILGVTIFGIAAHGAGRWMGVRRRQKRDRAD